MIAEHVDGVMRVPLVSKWYRNFENRSKGCVVVMKEDAGPARKDREFPENRQVTVRDVTVKIKKIKCLFINGCSRRSLIYKEKELLKLAIRLNIRNKVLGEDAGN